jgi:hypothetical protein
VHASVIEHETAVREAEELPEIFGVLSSFQDAPLKRSATAELPENPTAMQAFAEVHDTPRSWPAKDGADSSFQATPFHSSIKASWLTWVES